MVQTRSETMGIREFKTLAEAMEHACKDKSVWKVSFMFNNESVRLIRFSVHCEFIYEPM